jgi:hypothetical protein
VRLIATRLRERPDIVPSADAARAKRQDVRTIRASASQNRRHEYSLTLRRQFQLHDLQLSGYCFQQPLIGQVDGGLQSGELSRQRDEYRREMGVNR